MAKNKTYVITTFGCQMNARDSEKIAGMLEKAGYTKGDDENKADIVVFNTCTIRENANEHLYGRLGRLKKSKRQNPDKIIAVCGCMMQEADEIDKICKSYPYIDIVLGTHNVFTLPSLLEMLKRKREGDFSCLPTTESKIIRSSDPDVCKAEKLKTYDTAKNRLELEKLKRKPVISVWDDTKLIVEDLPNSRHFPFKQGINISYGCNNFCSYCIVPYVRGREKSRDPEEILKEVECCGKEGVKEIMLLGQNVNSYAAMPFPELLILIDELADRVGIERIRFMTSHPKDLTMELAKAMAAGRHICHQFHLPLQSGSSAVLKRMNRHYDRDTYLEKAEMLKQIVPDISISTDIIVGFPGETEADFEETLDVIKKVRFDSAYTFIYSKREGTPAASFPDQVPPEVVKERFNRLLELQGGITANKLNSLIGSEKTVLFESVSKNEPNLITGSTEENFTIHVPGGPELIGQFKAVKVTEAHGFYLNGILIY